MQQKIKEESCQVEVIDRQQQIEIAEHEIRRKECELDSKIRKPAEAEKFKLEKLAGQDFFFICNAVKPKLTTLSEL
jgi:flotillin